MRSLRELGVGNSWSVSFRANHRTFKDKDSRGLLLVISVRRAGALRTDKKLSSIGERNISSAPLGRPILGLKAVNDDFGAKRNSIFRKATPEQNVRSTCFDHPAGHLAIRTLHVDMEPCVAIDQFHLRDHARKADRMAR